MNIRILLNTVAQKCNFFLQITTTFYKLPLFSTNHNFFLQYGDFFLQITTFFIKPQLFYKAQLFFRILKLFYNAHFFPILQLFSTKHDFFHHTTTFSYISQLFSPQCWDFFLQNTTFLYKISTFI